MNKLKTALATGIAFAVGLVTLRTVRERRRTPREEAAEATKDALTEAGAAAEHAVAAAGHARVAGEKAVETAREEYRDTRLGASDSETEPREPRGRIRRVGKGWIRR